jgi:hypothetical protein
LSTRLERLTERCGLFCVAACPRQQLRELDLSSNCITSVSDDPFDGTEEPFPALETLHLGSQSPKLSPQALFAFAKLPELRTLRVPDNKIRGCAFDSCCSSSPLLRAPAVSLGCISLTGVSPRPPWRALPRTA